MSNGRDKKLGVHHGLLASRLLDDIEKLLRGLLDEIEVTLGSRPAARPRLPFGFPPRK